MRKRFLTFLLACGSLLFTAATPVFAVYSGKVGGVKLTDSQAVYTYSDGEILKDGLELPPMGEEGERVKRVALFYLWLERDPFFIAPGLDTAAMGQAVAKLAALEAAILGSLSPLEKLWPVEFLKAFTEASGAYDKFAASPSEAGAVETLDKIRAAAGEYSAAAEKISVSVEKFFALRGVDRVVGLGGGGITNKATVTGDFKLIIKNGAAAAKRLEDLANCLEKSSSFCKPYWPAFRERPAQGRPSTPIFKPKELGVTKWAVSGPYLMRAPCWHGQVDNYFYYNERCDADGSCADWDYLATDMLFRPVGAPREENKDLFDQGIKLAPFSPSSLYACGAREYIPVLRAMSYFERDYGSRPVFDGAQLPGLHGAAAAAVEETKKAEQEFFREKIKSQVSFEKLGGAYLRALEELDWLELPVKTDLRRRSRLATLYTDGFSYTLGRIVFHMRNPQRAARKMKKPPKSELMASGHFISRSFYSLLFLPFSPAIWRIPESLQYLSSMENINTGLLHYTEALKTYGQDEINKGVKVRSVNPNGRRKNVPE